MTPTTEIVTRQQAIARGLTHYFTGKPCAQGHTDVRRTVDRKCAGCNRMRGRDWRAANPDRVRAANAAYYAANGEQHRSAQREWNAANADYAAQWARDYRERNPHVASEWRKNNKQRVVLYTTRRRVAKLQRTPIWADTTAIDSFYLACPVGYEVDHIIPLRGRLVSGLHVVNNLQYLPRRENAKKRNKFDPETFQP